MPTVTIKSVDRDAITRAVLAFVAELRGSHPEVDQVIWFGSWAHGIPVPGSDVDLCLVLSSSDVSFRERVARYLPFGFPVGMDLFPYTRAELEDLQQSSPGWYAAMTRGQVL